MELEAVVAEVRCSGELESLIAARKVCVAAMERWRAHAAQEIRFCCGAKGGNDTELSRKLFAELNNHLNTCRTTIAESQKFEQQRRWEIDTETERKTFWRDLVRAIRLGQRIIEQYQSTPCSRLKLPPTSDFGNMDAATIAVNTADFGTLCHVFQTLSSSVEDRVQSSARKAERTNIIQKLKGTHELGQVHFFQIAKLMQNLMMAVSSSIDLNRLDVAQSNSGASSGRSDTIDEKTKQKLPPGLPSTPTNSVTKGQQDNIRKQTFYAQANENAFLGACNHCGVVSMPALLRKCEQMVSQVRAEGQSVSILSRTMSSFKTQHTGSSSLDASGSSPSPDSQRELTIRDLSSEETTKSPSSNSRLQADDHRSTSGDVIAKYTLQIVELQQSLQLRAALLARLCALGNEILRSDGICTGVPSAIRREAMTALQLCCIDGKESGGAGTFRFAKLAQERLRQFLQQQRSRYRHRAFFFVLDRAIIVRDILQQLEQNVASMVKSLTNFEQRLEVHNLQTKLEQEQHAVQHQVRKKECILRCQIASLEGTILRQQQLASQSSDRTTQIQEIVSRLSEEMDFNKRAAEEERAQLARMTLVLRNLITAARTEAQQLSTTVTERDEATDGQMSSLAVGDQVRDAAQFTARRNLAFAAIRCYDLRFALQTLALLLDGVYTHFTTYLSLFIL
jgi:hypothetical protein